MIIEIYYNRIMLRYARILNFFIYFDRSLAINKQPIKDFDTYLDDSDCGQYNDESNYPNAFGSVFSTSEH